MGADKSRVQGCSGRRAGRRRGRRRCPAAPAAGLTHSLPARRGVRLFLIPMPPPTVRRSRLGWLRSSTSRHRRRSRSRSRSRWPRSRRPWSLSGIGTRRCQCSMVAFGLNGRSLAGWRSQYRVSQSFLAWHSCAEPCRAGELRRHSPHGAHRYMADPIARDIMAEVNHHFKVCASSWRKTQRADCRWLFGDLCPANGGKHMGMDHQQAGSTKEMMQPCPLNLYLVSLCAATGREAHGDDHQQAPDLPCWR